MSSSFNSRLKSRSSEYDDHNDRSLSRRQYIRSRSSRSRSPSRKRSYLDYRSERNNRIVVCTSSSYLNEGDKFYICVGIQFVAKEYKGLSTACAFYTLNPPSIYMELIGCILILSVLKKNNLEHAEVCIYSKVHTLEACLYNYNNTRSKIINESILIGFLKDHIKARPGSVRILAGVGVAKDNSQSFSLAKDRAQDLRRSTKNYLYLLPKEISDEIGGKELYEQLKKADNSQTYNKGDFHDTGSYNLSPKLEIQPSPQPQHHTSTQLVLSPNTISPPPGWPSNMEYPLSYNSAIQLILTIISLTEVPNHPSMFSSSPSASSSPPPAPFQALSQSSISDPFYNNINNTSSLSNLPQPSRSGSLNSDFAKY